MSHFQRIGEENKLSLNKPLNSDMVYYSELNEWYTNNAFRSLSLKFVVDQSIQYRIDNEEYRVEAGSYLVACRQSDVKAYFDSEPLVKSICIDLCPDSFAEVYTVLSSGSSELDNYLSSYFRYPEFFESVNPLHEDPLSEKLKGLHAAIRRGEELLLNREWFLDLVEKLVYKEYGNYLMLQNLYTVKASTRKEILRRLQKAKEYIEADCLKITSIKQVAEHCFMSEYHFFRSFRQAFGLTPYQYITRERMKIASELLQNHELNLSEIAFSCNYPDASTFSKAFKRFYGYSPSEMR